MEIIHQKLQTPIICLSALQFMALTESPNLYNLSLRNFHISARIHTCHFLNLKMYGTLIQELATISREIK